MAIMTHIVIIDLLQCNILEVNLEDRAEPSILHKYLLNKHLETA
jgi:hypothetical protein